MNVELSLKKWSNSKLIAVSDANKDWTYEEFVCHAFQAKNYFVSNDIRKIIIGLPQCFYSYTLIWGAYLAGTIFCPINHELPHERKQFFVQELQPDIFFEDENKEYGNGLSSLKPETFYVRANIIPTYNRLVSEEDCAYVIFTSGSTGLPKGAMITRKGLENYLGWAVPEYRVAEGDVWGQFSNLGFDICICDVFEAVIAGATLISFATKGEKLLPALTIRNKKITIWNSVPSVIDLLGKSKHLSADFLKTLKVVILGGEKLYPSQLRSLFQANPDLIVYNTYGPTEVTIMCTYQRFTQDDYLTYCDTTASIGRALPGFKIELDKVESGIGEIVSVSEFNAKGYLGESRSSNESPFRKYEHQGILRNAYFTGDYAKEIEGLLYFVDRKDSQIKIMGNRIDLNEIDHQLRLYGCLMCLSIFRDQRIISFINIPEFSESTIREFLKKKLPVFYLPSKICYVESFPMNSNGKIDVGQLISILKD